MKARLWLNDIDQSTVWYNSTFEQAKTLYPHISLRSLKGLCGVSWSNVFIEAIIDKETEWGFSRDDWFVLNNTLFVSDDYLMAMFKLLQN